MVTLEEIGVARAKSGGVHVGTSGWTYDDWAGRFYPEDVRGAERLAFYAERFDTVEVNATFYRLPFQGMITGWNRRLPPEFHLVLKGSRLITHRKKLEGCDEPVAQFFDRVLPLKALKIVLWQLPPSLHKDIERLDSFLSMLPDDVRHAVEFRHPSWWDGETAELLARHRAAFVAVSHPRLPGDVVPTTDFLYLRFHGLGKDLYHYNYSKEELKGWAAKVKSARKGRQLYAFFNNDFEAHAPANARTFHHLLTGGG